MNRIYLWILILILPTVSCTVYREFPIEVYKPGEISIPPNVDNVTLVYRNFKYKADTLQNHYKDDYKLVKAKKDPKNLDSLMVKSCLDELAKNFKANTHVKNITILDNVFKPHSGTKMPKLNMSLFRQLPHTSNSGLIISLETFSYFFSEYSRHYNETASNEVITAAVWAVYNPKTDALLKRETIIDTVFWNAYDDEGNYQKQVKLPPRLSALKIASQLAGENYSKKFFASWTNVNRMYSVPPINDFKTAEGMVLEGKWDEAIALWRPYISGKQGKTAIHARYNTALAYEMKDDLNSAESLLNEAWILAKKYRSQNEIEMVELYQKVLKNRKAELIRLN